MRDRPARPTIRLMFKGCIRRPSHTAVVAYVALFVALGGTTYAATGGNFILGRSNSASTATQLSSAAANALRVSNTSGGAGIYASGGNQSKATAAVHGQSAAGNAIEGYSTANPAAGIYGQDNNVDSYGVAGHSDNGVAVVGDSSNGWAFQALGNAWQSRTGNGFVKAMAFVDAPNNPSDPIQQCFNSQLPPSQATSGNCGINFSQGGTGGYELQFNFQTNDRFLSAIPYENFGDRVVNVANGGTHFVVVDMSRLSDGQAANGAFWLFVY